MDRSFLGVHVCHDRVEHSDVDVYVNKFCGGSEGVLGKCGVFGADNNVLGDRVDRLDSNPG